MTWEQITTWLDQFTDKPIVYYSLCVVIGVVAAFVILSKTSIGRKALKELRALFSRNEQTAKDTLKKVQEVETLAKEKIEALTADYEQKLADFESKCEQKVACVVSYFSLYEERTFAVLEKIPNAKVQEQVQIFKKEYEEKKKEISDVVGVIYEDYASAIENAKQEVRAEYEEKISYLENQIAQINLYFSEVKGETDNGEREEGTNSDSAKEEIQEN